MNTKNCYSSYKYCLFITSSDIIVAVLARFSSILGTNVFQLCKNLGIDIKFCIPLYMARALSTTAALSWLWTMIIDAGIFWLENERKYTRFWLKLASTIWCLISCYLSFAFTDGLMLRWLFNYGPKATIVRLITLNAFNYYITTLILSFTIGHSDFVLPAWILIAVVLTGAYCVQDWLTSNIVLLNNGPDCRKVNFLEIAVFCVVPVGLASFFTMILLLWLRLLSRDNCAQPSQGP